MKKIVFFGAPDKSYLLLALGKLLAATGQQVLLLDSTMQQSVRGFVPIPDERPGSFLTEFEGLDVAAGFVTYGQLDQYMKQTGGGWPNYDVWILDTDHTEFVKGRDLASFDHRIWCSSFDKLSLHKNRELMHRLCLAEALAEPFPFFRLLYPFVEATIREPYIDSFYSGYPVRWLEPRFRIPLDERDVSVKIDNQHHERIDVRRLSGSYTRTVFELAKILFALDDREIKRAWKRVRRRDRRGT